MKKTHLYLLAFTIAAIALAAMAYKWQVLKFPLQPQSEVSVWTVQARVVYRPKRGPNTVTLQLPTLTPGFTVVDEKFIARNYSMLEQRGPRKREVQWAIRRARGEQALYYRATLVRAALSDTEDLPYEPVLAKPPPLQEPWAAASQTLLDDVREFSSDIVTYARELVQRFNQPVPGQEVAILGELLATPSERARFFASLLATRNIPARVLNGFMLSDEDANRLAPRALLAVHNGAQWTLIDPLTGAQGWPRDFLLWHSGEQPTLHVDANPAASVEFTVSRNLADAMAVAERRLEVQDANMVRYSLLSLPLQTQAVYRVLLMIPIGAFIMLLLRNIVGIKSFGTFMPVLIALAFRDTGVIAGVLLFALVISAGLMVRFYLERLRLLLVPRLTAILILVVLLMALVSVLSNRLGIEVGLSVSLFPMVIMAMTIERMSVAWDERGAGTAIREGIGSLLVAALAYLAMSWPALEHLVFVFPETLLVLFALTLLLGRYSGYRLTELYRFRALAREADPIAAAPSSKD
ncbi:MAG: hypothetical protein COW59_03200 [Lysobacterales bacterium CG17_big_fil_post_rev_8_21_14_2_50_64_11]|nr:MAG: hypothetical protein COW59_03200 [Xanthomonadales bacterium CG17_big_fil_post_rev_8_21_14_2_50_64_11]PIX60704.1 MAG: hypothetical protein COZ47_05880 [Xanthomonadales bacterium CG_4_10_14_3_um_filter_64_11]